MNVVRRAGVDEVGRGPLAGAVVTAAVILDPTQPISGLTDSKKISEKKRLLLNEEIRHKALAWSLGRAEVAEIDALNILQATLLAMQRAVEGLSIQPDEVWVDGNRAPTWGYVTTTVVGGDATVAEISAASILAKVARDAEMVVLDQQYPQYGFAKHKGYPTKQHLQALSEHGVLAEHRRSYAPVRRALMLRDL